MMIQIFHNILWSKYKGGVFSVLHTLAEKNGIDIDFIQIAASESNRVALAGVDLSYHRYPYKLLFEGAYDAVPKQLLVRRLFAEVWHSPCSLVLLPGYHTLEFWAMLCAGLLRNKTVGVFCDSTMNDRPRSALKAFLKRLFFSQCDIFFAYGVRSREYLMSFGVPREKIYFRCQAAALPHDYDPARALAARQELSVADAPRFLYVGRLSAEKNVTDLIRAFRTVLVSHPSARLVIVGEGPQKGELVALAKRLGLDEAVEFAGARDVEGLREEYLKACCLVLPSSSEPWGLVVNEALSYGCPVVVSRRCGCVPELVIDGRTGFSYECGNVEDLAAQLTAIPRAFSDTAATAKRCLNLIAKFSPDAAAKQILDGCRKVLEEGK